MSGAMRLLGALLRLWERACQARALVAGYAARSAQHHRRRHPHSWPLWVAFELGELGWYRGIKAQVGRELDNLLRWLGRGQMRSRHWAPRPGDLVVRCDGTTATVSEVSIRADWVVCSDGRRYQLRECVNPASMQG